MRCSTCQREASPDAAYCAGCGARLSSACESCGRTNPGDAVFCEGCGEALDNETAPVSGRGERAPLSYTPRHLADEILLSRSALEGERKQVTVLFADVKGSTELAEGLDPEELHRVLDGFFKILTDAVHRFEGTINQ